MKRSVTLRLLFLTWFNTFLLSFCLSFSVLRCISNFTEIGSRLIILIPLFLSLLVSIAFTIWETIARHKKKIEESRLRFWVSKNTPKLLLSYLILVFLLLSISNHKIWTTDEINNVLTLEWTIFGLSITIFLVWNVLIVDYLRKKQPVSTGKLDFVKHYEFLLDKRHFVYEIDTAYNTAILLGINLVLLLFSSTLVYISQLSEKVFVQIIVCCTFFFSTNTISLLFFDLLKPLKKDKEILKKDNLVSKGEMDATHFVAFLQEIMDKEFDEILNSEQYSDEEKIEQIHLCLEKWKNILSELQAQEDNEDDIVKSE